jgi:hypothetical protein
MSCSTAKRAAARPSFPSTSPTGATPAIAWWRRSISISGAPRATRRSSRPSTGAWKTTSNSAWSWSSRPIRKPRSPMRARGRCGRFFYLSTKFGWAAPPCCPSRSAIRTTARPSACGSCSISGHGPQTRNSTCSSPSRFRRVQGFGLHLRGAAQFLLADQGRQEPALDSVLLSKQHAHRRHLRLVARLLVGREQGNHGIVSVALLVRPLAGVELRRALSAAVEFPLAWRQHDHPSAALPLPQQGIRPSAPSPCWPGGPATPRPDRTGNSSCPSISAAAPTTAPRPSTCGHRHLPARRQGRVRAT